MHSEQLNELAKALSAAQGMIRGVERNKENPFFHSKYADLAACWDTARPALMQHGLAVTQTFDDTEAGTFLITTAMHQSGQWIASRLKVTPTKPDPQSLGSAITYARRYALAALLGLAADDDDDGNAASEEPKKQAPKPKGAPTKPVAEQWKAAMLKADKVELLDTWCKDAKEKNLALYEALKPDIRAHRCHLLCQHIDRAAAFSDSEELDKWEAYITKSQAAGGWNEEQGKKLADALGEARTKLTA